MASSPGQLPPSLSAFPNRQQITKTALPLLATVLAGFAVTVSAQVLYLTGVNAIQSPTHRATLIGLILITTSIPFLLASTIYSIWADASSYQHLNPDTLKVLGIKYTMEELEVKGYFTEQEHRWHRWYQSAVWSYYVGTALFVVGVCIDLANLLGPWALMLFIFATVISLGWLFVMGTILRNRG
jgi:hypothetical protein